MRSFLCWQRHDPKHRIGKYVIFSGLFMMWSLAVSLTFIFVGQEMNRIAVTANGGKMPVDLSDSFDSILSNERHFVIDDPSKARLAILIDRYDYDARRLQALPKPLRTFVSHSFFEGRDLRYEVGAASLGDYITWYARFILFVGSSVLLVLGVSYRCAIVLRARKGRTA